MKQQQISTAPNRVRVVVLSLAAGAAVWIGSSQPIVAQSIPTSGRSACSVLGPENGDQTMPQEANDPDTARALPGAKMGCLMNRVRWGSVMAVGVFATPQAACDQVETLRRTVAESPGRRVQLIPIDIGSRGIEAYEPAGNNDQIWFCRGVFLFAGAGVVGTGQMTRAELADYARAVDQRCRAFAGGTGDAAAWAFHTYANNVKALPPLRFDYQLGVSIIGSWTGGCDGHIHGWNNEDPGPRTSPATGGAPSGGQWAIVDIVKR